MIKTFKEVNLNSIPAPIANLLRSLIPEDADVEIIYADVTRNAYDVARDNCTPMGCTDCGDCPIDKAMTVDLTEPMDIISVGVMKLASLVRVNGNIAPEERNYAIDALSDISEAVSYALEVLEGGN